MRDSIQLIREIPSVDNAVCNPLFAIDAAKKDFIILSLFVNAVLSVWYDAESFWRLKQNINFDLGKIIFNRRVRVLIF